MDAAILKYGDMVKDWISKKKIPLLELLSKSIKNTENSAIPILKLYMKMILDFKKAPASATSTTKIITTSKSVGNASSAAQAAMMAEDPQNKKKDEPVASEVKNASPADTYINEVLDALSEKESVIDALLKNMAVYFETLK